MIMNRRILQRVIFIGIFVIAVVGLLPGQSVLLSQSQDEKLEQLTEEIKQYEQEIGKLKNQANTLSNQIAQFDAQIKLTTLKITETEEKILLLGGRIDQLETSLNSLSDAFSTRAVRTYKMSKVNEPMLLLISSPEVTDAVASYHYLQKIQEADRELLVRLEEAQGAYLEEKDDQERLQTELEEHKSVLGAQKSAKASLLEQTRNNEKKYQQLLVKARAEFDAIQAIIAGKGDETEIGPVNEGERIASVISGSSPCSSGTHLHFEVAKDGINQDPTSYLTSKSVDWDNAPDGQFGFSGSWQWPINDPVRITQGYGMTYYASALNYYGGAPHTGLDMVNKNDNTVKAVKSGKLYRGSIGCGGGILKYVRVEQEGENDTYYLHINY